MKFPRQKRSKPTPPADSIFKTLGPLPGNDLFRVLQTGRETGWVANRLDASGNGSWVVHFVRQEAVWPGTFGRESPGLLDGNHPTTQPEPVRAPGTPLQVEMPLPELKARPAASQTPFRAS